MFVDDRQRSVYDVINGISDPIDQASALKEGGKCGSCGGSVFARRPTGKIWHWVHRRRSPDCPGGSTESEWHLRMKRALHSAGYALEVYDPVNRFRYDAVTTCDDDDFQIVEVINSYSDKYMRKALAIHSETSAKVLWIINTTNARGAARNAYKPRFADLMNFLTGGLKQTVWLYDHRLYARNQPDIIEHPLHAHIIAEFDEISLADAQSLVRKRVARQQYARKMSNVDDEDSNRKRLELAARLATLKPKTTSGLVGSILIDSLKHRRNG